jgi:Tol biopolymer transport system component
MNKYWSANYDEINEIYLKMWPMRFKDSGGWVHPHCSQKVLLVMILHDYSMEAQNYDRADSRIHPKWNQDKQTIIYNSFEFMGICGWKTQKTLKKYLSFLHNDGFIFLNWLSTNEFEVSINFERILNAPRFEEKT